jgi:hypothetical protein
MRKGKHCGLKVRSVYFFGYSKDVKGYRLLQPHCNEIIIRRDVKFDENLLACEPNLVIVSSSTCKPSSTFVSSPIPILVSSSEDDNDDENTPLLAHLPLDEFIEHEPTPTPLIPIWVRST